MEFTDFMIWKAAAVIGLVCMVSFVYRVVTGRSLEEALDAAAEAREGRPPAGPAGGPSSPKTPR
jgi:hypothetical protein